jgi:hypothetical protein
MFFGTLFLSNRRDISLRGEDTVMPLPTNIQLLRSCGTALKWVLTRCVVSQAGMLAEADLVCCQEHAF